jgi:hypothetical protein
MFITKETERKQDRWAAKVDINRKSAQALREDKIFASAAHKRKVAFVEREMRRMFDSWGGIYTTPRPKTKRRLAHTEVKFYRVEHTKLFRDIRADVIANLNEVGVDLVFKPGTNSYSAHVR